MRLSTLIGAGVFFLAICAASMVAAAEPGGRLVVGSEVDFPPYAIVNEHDEADGFSVDLIKAVAEVMDLKVDIRPGNWDAIWMALRERRIDILPLVAQTPERQALVDFSVPHTVAYDSFFVRQDSPDIASLDGAAGKSLIVMRADAAHEQLLARGFRGNLVLTDTVPDALRLLASGRHDAVLIPKLMGQLYIRKLHLDHLRGGPPLTEYRRTFSFAIAKGNAELIDQLNQGVSIVKASGRYDQLLEKWFGVVEVGWRPPRWLLTGAVVVAVALLSVTTWLVLLRRVVRRRTEALTREIAERRKVEARLAEHAMALQRSNEELEQFAYVASHDLREPLRTISSYVTLLERRYGEAIDDDGREFIAYARDGAQRMDRLILDLLEYSRVGRLCKPMVPVALEPVIWSALAGLAADIGAVGAEVTVDPDLPTIIADEGEIGRLVANLVSNAIKYRDPTRPLRVRIGATREGEECRLFVEDNGIGIEARYFEKIFRIFQRLHNKFETEGSGIGLAICKKVADRHGGRIWVESEPGQGSRFCVTLPAPAG